MKFSRTLGLAIALALVSQVSVAATNAEIKLIDPLEEARGWCIDLFAHLKGAMPIGGFQTHNCFSGENKGAPTEDQAFESELLLNKGRIRLVYFDVCLTMHEPKAGSFVAAEPCNSEEAQHFEFKQTGEIVPAGIAGLCLTAGAVSVPGGGGEPVHLIRKLSFEQCDARIAARQRWELRYKFRESVPTLPRPYD